MDCLPNTTSFQVLKYEKDCENFPVIAGKCRVIKYGDNYHVSNVENATGDPTLASNTDFSPPLTEGEAIAYIACHCADCKESVRDNGDGTYTFINSDGSTGVTWVGSEHPDDPKEQVRDNGDGSYTYIKADGSDGVTWIGSPHPDQKENVRKNSDGSYTFINSDGTDGETWTIPAQTYENVRKNSDGSYTFINADGTDGVTWTIPAQTTQTFENVRNNGDNTYTFINADGSDGETWDICGCPDTGGSTDKTQVLWADPGANFSGGFCFGADTTVNNPTDVAVLQGRDGASIGSAGTVFDVQQKLGYLKIVVKNPYDEPVKLTSRLFTRSNVSNFFPDTDLNYAGVVYCLSETLEEAYTDDTGSYNTGIEQNWVHVTLHPNFNQGGTTEYWNISNQATGSCVYERMLAANEEVTLYSQWWMSMKESSSIICHPLMHVSYELHRNVTKIESEDYLVEV